MTPETAAKAIAYFEAMRQEPELYIGGPDVDAAIHHLIGFESACLLLEGDGPTPFRHELWEARNMTDSAYHPGHQMQQRGLDSAAIVTELLTVEIEAWTRFAANLFDLP